MKVNHELTQGDLDNMIRHYYHDYELSGDTEVCDIEIKFSGTGTIVVTFEEELSY
jgi:hypothetical protein